jgi:hypothetical protein
MNYSLPLEPFDVWGFDFMGPFPPSNNKQLVECPCVATASQFLDATI